ncbi:MAG: hypothetical protein ABIO70_29965 [Pseudomonadota bacterium]
MRTSPLLPILILLAGCDRFHGDDTSPPASPPPELWAVAGTEVTALWASRDLQPGERIERLDDGGQGTTIATEGHLWVDVDPGETYRWVGPAEQVEIVPEAVTIAASDPPLSDRHDRTGATMTWSGPALDGLPLGLAVERGDGTWLWYDPDGIDVSWGWASDPAWWERWDDGALPAEVPTWWDAEEPEPVAWPATFHLQVIKDEVGFDIAEATVLDLQTGRFTFWGDLHSHTNYSYDGCEDKDNLCAPRGDWPASDAYSFAEDAGLDFIAITDHAEFKTWLRDDLHLSASIWEASLLVAQDEDGGRLVPIVGYEWTASFGVLDPENEVMLKAGGHRTVLFDALEPCEDYWIGGARPYARKVEWGVEDYRPREAFAEEPDELMQGLADAATTCGDGVRYLSWYHHPAMDLPRPVLWSADINRDLGDRVVEIYSEHGSSECADPTDEGCDWMHSPHHVSEGAVQTALQEGHALGFVGGTDSHDGRPGSTADGPGAIVGTADSEGNYIIHMAPGGITGALTVGMERSRGEIFDAIEARHTFAASWRFGSAKIAALGQDGVLYLPGDDVPAAASPVTLMVRMTDSSVEGWQIQVLDAWGEVWLDEGSASLTEPLDIAAGDVRYVRVRADIQGIEHRLWASPFFGVE